MGRSSISDKAKENADRDLAAEAREKDEETDESDEQTERVETTYRADAALMDRLDRAQDQLGLPSRNATLTFLAKQKLDDLDIE